MKEKFRIFLLLLHKSFLIRKRHWIQSLLLQILIPIGFILLGQSIPSGSTGPPELIQENETYYPLQSENSLMEEADTGMVLRYTPSNIITDKIMEEARKCLRLTSDQVVASPNESAIVDYFLHETAKRQWMGRYIGIVFQSMPDDVTLPKSFKYKLRIDVQPPPDLFIPEGARSYHQFEFSQESMVQVPICLDKAYIKQVVPNPQYETSISIQRMPYPSYVRVQEQSLSVSPFAIISSFVFLIVLCVEMTFAANEKLIGVNVLMSVNGVSNRLNLLSWFVSGAIWSTSYLLPAVIILKYYKTAYVPPFLLNGNAFLVWLSLFIHVCHLLAFGLHFGSYFPKPSYGITATVIAMSVPNIISNSIQQLMAKRSLLYVGIFIPDSILRRIVTEISAHEHSSDGLRWSNLFTSTSDSISEGSVGLMIVFSIIGILFNFCMAVYIHAIRPGKYGVPQHPLYFFKRSGNTKVDEEKLIMDVDYEEQTGNEFEYVEPGSLVPGIQIRDLKKVYATDLFRQAKVNALRGVSVDIYKSQITALLGHNGAGKTTMMSILSGLTDATEGVAFIDGKNILTQTNGINNNIGLCPQENILFPDLTVHQQLMFFGMMRASNRTRLQLENEVHTLLSKVNLTDKANNYPAQLSGGQKRRLCLALAIIGDAKVLILDEPTSGMDAESKREVWDILLKMRGQKTIVISTHDMEEADILGDRIAIMHTGKLRCYGTSMFLKKLYGDGQIEVTLSIAPWCNISKISEEIGITANILNQDDGKITLTLPPAESLPGALDKLENSKTQLGITGMSVSIITLEQVFVRVTQNKSDKRNSNENILVFEKITGFPYYLQTFSAFFTKKLKYARKNPWNLLISMLLPCVSALLSFLLSSNMVSLHPYPLALSEYPDARTFVHSDKPQFSEMYLKTIQNYGGDTTEVTSDSSVTDVLMNYARNNKASYRQQVIVSAEFNDTPTGDVMANGFYSGSAVLSIPITINCITNTIVKALTNDEEYKIEMSAQKLPYEYEMSKESFMLESIMLAICLIIFLTSAVVRYVEQPLSEILSDIKQLQIMTGAPKLMYWAATFSYDFAQYTLSIFLLLVVLLIIDTSTGLQLYHGTEIGITLTLLLLFGISVLLLIYLCTFFKLSNNATTIILTMVPIVLVITDFLLKLLIPPFIEEKYRILFQLQSKIFLLLPHVSLAHGYYVFLLAAAQNAHCRQLSIALPEIHNCDNPISYFDVDEKPFLDLQGSLLWLGLLPIVYCGIIFILEQHYFEEMVSKLRGNEPIPDSEEMDEMVKEEQQIINEKIAKLLNGHLSEQHENADIFLVQRLKKSYGKLHAVKGISFRVKKSECFGLLGVNGAGKSTTFKMLTGDIIPNSGTVYLKQYNNSSNRSEYLSSMGYCPQHDAIIDTLNSWDHLYLFARLRGIPPSQVSECVEQWITKLHLTPCASQPSSTYSGGNKRRLNIALALIGNPPLALMDEPTTGVDPAARRSLWDIIKTCQHAGQSIILTSHSMEECEVLCNRLVIMVGGRIVCVGASEQLKQRFGAGYNIHVKLSSTHRDSDVEAIKKRIIAKLNCHLIDENTGFLGYHVVDPNATWTIMYTLMDELKNEYGCIEDYVVLSSTLEQLFIQFARSPNNLVNDNDKSNDESSQHNFP